MEIINLIIKYSLNLNLLIVWSLILPGYDSIQSLSTIFDLLINFRHFWHNFRFNPILYNVIKFIKFHSRSRGEARIWHKMASSRYERRGGEFRKADIPVGDAHRRPSVLQVVFCYDVAHKQGDGWRKQKGLWYLYIWYIIVMIISRICILWYIQFSIFNFIFSSKKNIYLQAISQQKHSKQAKLYAQYYLYHWRKKEKSESRRLVWRLSPSSTTETFEITVKKMKNNITSN